MRGSVGGEGIRIFLLGGRRRKKNAEMKSKAARIHEGENWGRKVAADKITDMTADDGFGSRGLSRNATLVDLDEDVASEEVDLTGFGPLPSPLMVSATSPTDDGGVICDDRLISGRGRFSIGKPTALESPSLGSPSLRRVLAAARRCLPGGAACLPGRRQALPGRRQAAAWPACGWPLPGVWLDTARRLAAGVGLAVANRRLPLQLKKKPKIMQQHLDSVYIVKVVRIGQEEGAEGSRLLDLTLIRNHSRLATLFQQLLP
ncbi:hypothetical protein ZIOFF_071736 [Zingiber officinale]|uniref:Uncharacterized protein n=1 Tax=Zingiber officinale TaxID=94328 RepID=A0A8J5CBX9_ZINOF|nr:hypothetical protein ZIOFF_071736 [Zingiber officinale]